MLSSGLQPQDGAVHHRLPPRDYFPPIIKVICDFHLFVCAITVWMYMQHLKEMSLLLVYLFIFTITQIHIVRIILFKKGII